MSSSVKTIRLTILLSILFVLLTYLITVNMELGFVSINSGWISSNFFLTVFGGAFGSTVVVLICELHRYWILKKETEIKIYSTLYSILAEIIVSNNSTRTYLQNTDLPVPEKTLDANRERVLAAISTLEAIDYRPLFKKNIFWLELTRFSQEAYQKVKQFISDEQFLNIAVLKDRLDMLKRGVSGDVTAKCPNTGKTLEILLKNGVSCAEDLKALFDCLDSIRSGEFKWSESKQKIESFQTVLGLNEYEKFIDRGKTSIGEEKSSANNGS